MGAGLRVALVHGRAAPEFDGVADYVRHLTAALGDAGADVHPVPVQRGGPPGVLDAARRVRAAAPDVVHVQFAPSAYRFSPAPGLLPLLLRGLPLVTTLHEYGWWSWPARVPDRVWSALEDRRWWDRETGRLVPASDLVLTTNAEHAAAVRRRFAVPAATVPLAPNVADAGPPQPGARGDLGVPDGAELLVFFGFVHPVKGIRYLLEALAVLRAERPRLHLLVAGGFTSLALPEDEAAAFRAELTAHAAACGVAGAVTFTGHLPAERVSAALHAADVAVFPFTAGATTKSGALLSAFAHGLPAVVTVADDPDPELVDGATVVVAGARRDSAALVTALRRVLGDPALRARVAAGGAALAEGRTWPRLAEAHLRHYAELRAQDRVRA